MEQRTLIALSLIAAGLIIAGNAQSGVTSGAVPDSPSGAPDLPLGPPDMNTPFDANTDAFLAMIRRSEGMAGASDIDRYHTFYGGKMFNDFSDHPALLDRAAWAVKLTDAQCAGAGLGPGCVSTAAGAYQINVPTWGEFRKDNGDGYGYLADFSPASQDIAGYRLLVSTGATDLLASGDFAGAVAAASRKWASLPGNRAGQRQQPIAALLAWFGEAGGNVA
jgi:lysozyme